MTESIHWGDVATWTSAVVLVLTLAVLWWQIRDVRRSVQGATYERICTTMIEIDRFFVDHPELRPYFYRGKSIAGIAPLDQEKLDATAEMLTDFFYDVFHQKDLMPRQTFEPYNRWMKMVYAKSPALQAFIPTGTYDDVFVNHLKGTIPSQKPKRWWQFWNWASGSPTHRPSDLTADKPKAPTPGPPPMNRPR